MNHKIDSMNKYLDEMEQLENLHTSQFMNLFASENIKKRKCLGC